MGDGAGDLRQHHHLLALTLTELQTHLGLDSFHCVDLGDLLATVLPSCRALSGCVRGKSVADACRDLAGGGPDEMTLEDFLARVAGGSVAPAPLRTPGRKRVSGGDGTERKQKRMIKNRESAARSRARKQAYTHELENKILRLEEENERLKKQKELEMLLFNAPPPEPKRGLRRISSALF